MLNQIRLMFIALFMGLFLVACGDDSATQQEAAPAETAEATTETAAATTGAEAGMTEEEAIAKWGEPDIQQSRTIDALTITHYEWHGEDGITSVQFENGKATYSQFIAAE